MTEGKPAMQIGPDDVLLGLPVANKPALLHRLATHAASRLGAEPAPLLALLQAREALGSTGIGRGIALPHARLPGMAAPLCCLCRLARPIPFDAIDDAPVDLVFLLLTPAGADTAHLATLAAAARRLRDPATAAALRRAADAGTIARLLGA